MDKKDQKAIKSLQEFCKDIQIAYANKFCSRPEIADATFAAQITHCIVKHKSILDLLSTILRKDLADTILTHSPRYLENFQKLQINNQLSKNYAKDIDKSQTILTGQKPKPLTENSDIRSLAAMIVKNIQHIIASPKNSDTHLGMLISLSMSVQFSLPIAESVKLGNDLFLFCEMFMIPPGHYDEENLIVRFHNQFGQIFADQKSDDIKEIFQEIANYLVNVTKSLEQIPISFIKHLYMKIRDNDRAINNMRLFINEVYKEAKLRYSMPGLDDHGFELLNATEKFDQINEQVTNLHQQFTKDFLLKKILFSNSAKNLLIENAPHINALKISTVEQVNILIDLAKKANIDLSKFIELIDRSITPDTIKKYQSLDKYQRTTLIENYKEFFTNITYLINKENSYERYLSEQLSDILSSYYYPPNVGNSLTSLRLREENRQKIKNLFILGNMHIFFKAKKNAISNLSVVPLNSNISKVNDFTCQTIINLIAKANGWQIACMYEHLQNKATLNKTEQFIFDSLKKEITKRSKLGSRCLDLFKSAGREWRVLKKLKKM